MELSELTKIATRIGRETHEAIKKEVTASVDGAEIQFSTNLMVCAFLFENAMAAFIIGNESIDQILLAKVMAQTKNNIEIKIKNYNRSHEKK